MSNILIIKHGSLGDLIQANGAIEDIKNTHKSSKVLLLTSFHYASLMSKCPYIDGVIIDKRLPRWNLYYLYKLKKVLEGYKFTHIFDLQNSSRTRFYRRFLLRNILWSSTDTILEFNEKKEDFDKDPVLERMEVQLRKSGIKISSTSKANLSWAFIDIKKILNKHFTGEYILLFPFCSKKHQKKKWPYFQELIVELKKIYKNRFNIITAPGPNEIEEANKFEAIKVLNDDKRPLNLDQLISLVKQSSYVISNDTGPAHICTHLDKNGIVLFGSHTTAKKVSIESKNFKSISVEDLKSLNVEKVVNEITKNLN